MSITYSEKMVMKWLGNHCKKHPKTIFNDAIVCDAIVEFFKRK